VNPSCHPSAAGTSKRSYFAFLDTGVSVESPEGRFFWNALAFASPLAFAFAEAGFPSDLGAGDLVGLGFVAANLRIKDFCIRLSFMEMVLIFIVRQCMAHFFRLTQIDYWTSWWLYICSFKQL